MEYIHSLKCNRTARNQVAIELKETNANVQETESRILHDVDILHADLRLM